MRSSVLQTVFVFTLIITGVFSSSPARAQSIAEPDTWTVTPFLNVGFGTSADGSSLGLGVAAAYDFTSNLGFEAELGHLFDVAGDDHDIDWAVTTFSANAIYHFDVMRVTPYATVGLGLERSSIDVVNPDPLKLYQPSSTEVVWNFGGGAKYKLNENLLVRGDLRRFQATDLAPDFWRLYGGVTFWVKR